MSNNYYTLEEVVKLLKQAQGSKTITDLASDIGVSMQLLSAVLAGNRKPAGKILKYLKIKKAIVYRRG